MFQNVLKDIGGIGIFDVISICLFVVVFTGALVFAACLKKPFLKEMSTLPLQNEDAPTPPNGDDTHE
jgi:hypothetical protein